MFRLWVIVALVAFAAAPAAAQLESVSGIGLVHADERTFLCRDPDPVEALNCARDQCHEMAPGQSCVRAAWCFPSGWSAIIRIWRDDLAVPSAICGAPTEIAIQRTVAEYCSASEDVTSCDLTHLVDPKGFEKAVEEMQFPGGAPAKETSEDGMTAEEVLPEAAEPAGAPAPEEAGAVVPALIEAEPVQPEPVTAQ